MNEYLGTLRLFGGTQVPKGYLPCKGDLLDIHSNIPLYALLGTTYGGDGRTSFALPALNAPIPGLTWLINANGVFPPRP